MGQKLGHVGLVKKKSFFIFFIFFWAGGKLGSFSGLVWFVLPRLAVSPSCLGPQGLGFH